MLPLAEKAWPISKYIFFADVAKLFREMSAQETEDAFAHFRLLHPERRSRTLSLSANSKNWQF